MTEVVASTQPTIRKRNRANTVTQNDFKIPQQEEEEEVQKQIQDLQINKNDSTIKEEDEEEVINNDDDEEIEDDMVERHHHRSTISSIHSFASSANYDLLLARLGSKDSSVTSETNEIKTSFERVYNEAHEPHEKEEQEQEEIDWEFWSKVISDFNSVAKSEPKVLSYQIQRGIPPTLRGMVWQLFAKSKNHTLEETYMQLINEESVYEKAILRDLPKTYTDHEYFQGTEGQAALFNIVKAYSIYDTELGYSQGVSFIAGPLLLNMPEEEAFCVLVQLMNKYSLRGHFLTQPDLISQRLYQLEGLVGDHLPHVQRHLLQQGVRSNAYAYQWFSTLFAFRFPLETVFRIYDMIFAEGVETLFRFSLALLERNQSTLLSLEYDDLIQFLKSDLLNVYKSDANQLVQDAFRIVIVQKRLDRLAKAYQVESSRVSNEVEAIETLKKQNKELSDAIKQLEGNYSTLNQDHTSVANELISAKMDIARIHDENDVLAQTSNELKKKLECMPKQIEERVKEEMDILYTKNKALVERNTTLEEQLAYMENMIIEIKQKYGESENEREVLSQRLVELKKIMA